jgi:hypothetical protein
MQMQMKDRGYWGRWGKEIITGVIIAVIAAYLIGEGRFARREGTESAPPAQRSETDQRRPEAPATQPMDTSRPVAPTKERAEKDPSKRETKTPPTVDGARPIEDAPNPARPDLSRAKIPWTKQTTGVRKPNTNNPQDHSPVLIPPSSGSVPSLKSTPPDIANIHRALRSIKKKVDLGNPHGIADPTDVSAFDQYLSSLKRKTEVEEIKVMSPIVPENYTQMRDLKAGLSGLLVALEVNYYGLSES